jgi:hypothetical protein
VVTRETCELCGHDGHEAGLCYEERTCDCGSVRLPTDIEIIRALLDRAQIPFEEEGPIGPDMGFGCLDRTITVERGYRGFCTVFAFRPEGGSLRDMGAYE